MDTVINILIVLALLGVVVPLVMGGVALVRVAPAGDADAERRRSHASNTWMRRRVTLQAVAVGVLCFAFWWKSAH